MKDKKYYKKVAIGIVVGIISAIAIVGFIKAPSKSSDRLAEDLQKEFKANQKMLKEQDAAKQTSADQDTSDSKDAKEESTKDHLCWRFGYVGSRTGIDAGDPGWCDRRQGKPAGKGRRGDLRRSERRK